MIEEITPGNRTRFKIIKTIYENPGINITNLIKKAKASPNLIIEFVNKLSSYNIISEEKTGGRIKTHSRTLKANFDNETSRLIYALLEMDKKFLFLKKYKKLKSYSLQLDDIIKNKQTFILIYGSYARFAATKDSDLDVLVVGELSKKEIEEIREIFITLENELSLKIETTNNFLKNKNKPLYQNILREHIIIYGTIKFIEVLNI